ncbi:MAG TPA: amino acid adenylation domain-containing protein [Candidatus Sulfomarinibacteraceae bacterium]|nr:amino acid adenylation domain-containing protein [Candidatus Sulfomarinibacteraceae bacterium]
MDVLDAMDGTSRLPTLVALLRARAAHNPEKLAYIFLEDGESDETRITYGELDRRARAFAAWLQRRGAAGERALLLYPPGLDYIAAYFGCLYAGVVAVPAYPPRLNRPSPRVERIVTDAQAALALTTTTIQQKLERRFEHMPALAALRWLNSDELPPDLEGAWAEPVINAETLAFLQYTSGSTSAPKGVMVTHGNLMHNLGLIQRGFDIDSSGRGVFWLPSYHDMGLIGGVLEPMYVNALSVLMAPTAFLQRPVRWLQTLSRYGGNISGAPNFAYQMCVDKIAEEQCAGLDLSRWDIAFCGAEPIRHETLAQFAEKFAPYGFRAEAFYPCYGLAEATLLVSGGDGPGTPRALRVRSAALAADRVEIAAEDEDEAQTIVSCGYSRDEQRIVIVDPQTLAARGPDEVGEIWVAGDSVAQGYWDRPQATQETFRALLADSGEGPFLRTGDLGFLHEDELYVTGRLKDLIIIRGRNHYPQDIEQTVAESHEAFEMGMGAAFSVTVEGQEALVVTYELKRSHRRADVDEVTAAARAAIAATYGLQPQAIVLLKPLSIPRTSSGKIRRHACRDGYLAGTLDAIGEWTADTEPLPSHAASLTADQNLQPANLQPATIEQWLATHLAARLQTTPDRIDPHRPFVEYGLDSVQAVELVAELEEWLGRSLPPTLVWDYPNVAQLAAFLAQEQAAPATTPGHAPHEREPVAIVGLGCRFPGADGPESFWQLLREGVDAIDEVPPARWDVDRFYGADGEGAAPGKMNTRWGGFLPDVDQFDPHFFGISPREAQRMDPQQRLLLEVAWEALEHAGQPPRRLAGSRTGVFVGISSYDYSRLQFSDPAHIDAYAGTGNAHSVAANRLSYILDLKGPSMAIDTACSSSLVAVHLAVQSLRSGESDLALAGGVNLLLSPELTITFSQARMMAADGRCKTFDTRADGYVRGEGAGVVVLKRLSDARRDGDRILAVVRGSAINQDGRSNGLTAPHGPSQQAVIRQALADAGAAPADLSYVEAHGTGTPLGDPIEVQALRAVLEADDEAPARCLLGSVKTNVGHLEAAAGVAGLIKVVLALQHEEIPPHLHFEELNPYIDLQGSPLSIAAARQPWPRGEQPRLAGVSSFGFGGANAHVVLAEGPQTADGGWPLSHAGTLVGGRRSAAKRALWLSRGPNNRVMLSGPPGQGEASCATSRYHLLPLSAKSPPALAALVERWERHLGDDHSATLADLCFTAATGRDHFQHRAAFVAPDRETLAGQLSRYAGAPSDPLPTRGKIAFVFTGQGSQYPHMARRLYETQPVFRAALDRCDEILRDELELPLLDVLYGTADRGNNVTRSTARGRATKSGPFRAREDHGDYGDQSSISNLQSPISGFHPLIHQTAFTQPALFAVEYALAQLLRSWGVEPDVVLGHSVGEVVAACVARVFSLEDGLRLAAKRGRLMQALPAGGSMAAVFAGREKVEAVLAGVSGPMAIAAVNGPDNVTISGTEAAVSEAVAALNEAGVETRPLSVSHAFHSPLMEPMLDQFEAAARAVTYRPPAIPLVSNVHGRLFGADDAPGDAPDAAYWREHVRQPVDFAAGVSAAAAAGATIFVEVGPQPHLSGLVRRVLQAEAQGGGAAPLTVPLLRREEDDEKMTLSALAALYAAGVDPDWDAVYAPQQRKVAAPTYPFQRRRYWLDVDPAPGAASLASAPPVLGRVQRLPTALPLYQGRLRPEDEADLATYLRAALLEVAGDLWGAGRHDVDLWLRGEDAPPGRAMTVQIAPALQSGQEAACQIFRLEPETQRWHVVGGAQLQRGSPVEDGEDAAQSAPAEDDAAPLHERLLAADKEAHPALAQAYLREWAAAVLGLPPAQLDPSRPLDTLGLDSLMAVELRNRIERELGLTLPVVKFLQGPSVQDLARELLALWGASGDAPSHLPSITPTGHDPAAPAPLSHGQQAMWFLHQLLPDDLAFNVAGAVHLEGALHVDALRRALAQVLARHPQLRAAFSAPAGLPQQVAQSDAPLPFEEVDAGEWDEARLQAYLEQEAHRPFDLENGPLLRVVLARRGPQQHVLLLSVTHVVADFWSMALLVEELSALYLSRGEADLPAPAVDYVDYVLWQREMLDGPQGQRLRDYWLEQLGGELPLLDLPTDRPRPPQQTFEGDMVSRRLSPALAQRLRALAQEQGVTLATALLAAFQALLHRYSGQDDLLVGSVLSGRERPELAHVVGYLINPVALRADFAEARTFAALLQQARQTMLEAFEHQAYPLPLLAEALDLQRDAGRPPLFETMFIMQKAQVLEEQGLNALALGLPGAQLSLGDLTVRSMRLGRLPAQFDLTLMMAELDEGLSASLHYNTALFDTATAERMLAHLEALLHGVIEQPDAPLAAIPLLTGEERLLLRDWNRTEADYPRHEHLHTLIEAQAARTPRAVALRFGDQRVTYEALNRRANRLARALRRRGVGPGALVAVALERSPALVVALFGVLKAGAAYVPLDPAFPKARLQLMLEDAQPRLLLTEEALLPLLPHSAIETLCVDRDAEMIAAEAAHNPQPPADLPDPADLLAYVIYTSGSTGRPKGVAIPHRAVVNFLYSMRREPGLGPDDVLLAVTTLSFDIAVLELYLPLLVGAQAAIAPAEVAADGAQLAALLDEVEATVMQATPATWRMLLESGWQGKADLRALCGGEALSRPLAKQLLARCAALWNLYGPTETTVWSTVQRVRDGEGPVPIGRPIANTQIYILDAAGQPAPVGVAGDLYIGGDGLARGYLNRPELTAERFVTVEGVAGEPMRLYKTGDIARYRAGGAILYLGRKDHQVKVRGFRIELGEIEAALAQHPAVQRSVVAARGEGAARRLVAYVVPVEGRQADKGPEPPDLQQFLRRRLPDYMVPAAFVPMQALPLTPNNKVDRRALPAPPRDARASSAPYVAPRTPLEEELVAMCAAVLARDAASVGVEDDFFDLGGNSLLATRLVFQVREQYEVQIPLRRLFVAPTVAALAQIVEAGGTGDADQEPDAWRISVEELKADAVLAADIDAAGRAYEPPAEPQRLFLTGATGFVGAFLLRDLLRETEATVTCLVRAADAESGLQRLRRNLQAYGLWQEAFAARIVALPGDLAQPRLGLDEAQFRRLAREMDAVYHNGALVNFVYPYHAHRAANVSGTEEVLRLAAQERLAPVHFVSTLSVFHNGEHDDGVVYSERHDLEAAGAPFGGYAQSKWVAEKLVQAAMGRGIPAAIYRPGLVSGDSETGAWNTADMMTTLARLSLALGAAPQLDEGDKETQVDVVPVDYVSAAIVRLSLQPDCLGRTFHLNNPRPWSYARLLQWANEAGLGLETVTFARWRERLVMLALQAGGPSTGLDGGPSTGLDGGNGANPFLPLIEEVSAEQVFMPAFDCSQTLAGLADSDVSCPPVGPALLQTYLDYLRQKGLVPPGRSGRNGAGGSRQRQDEGAAV